MTTTVDTSDALTRIKESVQGKSSAELLQLRRDLTRHVRDLEPHLQGTEITQRFGSTGGMQSHQQQAARIERHKAEIRYLDELLQAADPVLAAQAAAE